MKISIVCVGKIKEKFYREAVDEYARRLSRYCKFEILEVADEKIPERAREAEEQLVLEREGERILSRISEDAYVCTLEILGKKYTSEGFAGLIRRAALEGRSHIVFVIGGSLGLHEKVLERRDCSVSFSDMTFPHQLMRVILSEQIYRAYRILQGEPYHK